MCIRDRLFQNDTANDESESSMVTGVISESNYEEHSSSAREENREECDLSDTTDTHTSDRGTTQKRRLKKKDVDGASTLKQSLFAELTQRLESPRLGR